MVKVTVDVINPAPNSIYCVLKRRIGREPTNAELREECHRIMRGDDFTLTNDPPAPRRAPAVVNEPERQRVLIDGLDCLPGQLDLF